MQAFSIQSFPSEEALGPHAGDHIFSLISAATFWVIFLSSTHVFIASKTRTSITVNSVLQRHLLAMNPTYHNAIRHCQLIIR